MATNSKAAALFQVTGVLALVLVALFFYNQHVQEKARISQLTIDATKLRKSNDQLSLLAAKKSFEQIGKFEDDPEILSALTEISLELSYLYGSQEVLKDAKAYNDLLRKSSATKAQLAQSEAFLSLIEGNNIKAAQLAADAIKGGVNHPKMFYVQALAELAQGKAQEADETAQKGLRMLSSYGRLIGVQGQSLLASGNGAAAKHQFAQVLTNDRENLLARIGLLLSDAISRTEPSDKLLLVADKLLKEINAKGGAFAKERLISLVNYAKGEISLEAGKADNADGFAKASFRDNPKNAQNIALMGRLLARNNNPAQALAKFEEALKLAPASRMIATQGFWSMHRIGKSQDGIKLLQSVRANNQADGRIFIDLASAYAEVGDEAPIADAIENAVKRLGDKNELVWYARGRSLQAQGKTDAARAEYKTAVETAGRGWGDLYYQMGRINLREKDIVSAIELFNEAIRHWDLEQPPLEGLISAYETAGKEIKQWSNGEKMEVAEKYLQKAKNLLGG